VGKIQSLEQFKDIEPNVKIGQRGIQDLEIRIVDGFKDQTWRLGGGIPRDIQQLDDVGPTAEILQDLDLTADLLLLDGLEDLDDALLIVGHVDSLEDFAVFSPANLLDDFVIVLISPVHGKGFIVPILRWPMLVDFRIDSGATLNRPRLDIPASCITSPQ